MVHNGIEYGLMQAYAEGFDILRERRTRKAAAGGACATTSTSADIAEVWRRGSVVASWLLDLTADGARGGPEARGYTGFVQDSGEGRWTVHGRDRGGGAGRRARPPSLYTRFRSRQEHTFAEKVLSAMRAKFGGHTEKPAP